MSETKYFYALNANQRIAGIAFEPVDIFAGSVYGVYATNDEKAISALSSVAHVNEITKESYDSHLKKKAPSFAHLKHSNAALSSQAHPPAAPVAVALNDPGMKDKVGIVVEGSESPLANAPVAENLLEPRPIVAPASPGKRKAK